MTKLSKLWLMAYNEYMDAQYYQGKNINKDTLTDMEETLLYWWTRASCEELKPAYAHLKIKVEARKRLIKTLNANCGQ